MNFVLKKLIFFPPPPPPPPHPPHPQKIIYIFTQNFLKIKSGGCVIKIIFVKLIQNSNFNNIFLI